MYERFGDVSVLVQLKEKKQMVRDGDRRSILDPVTVISETGRGFMGNEGDWTRRTTKLRYTADQKW